MIEALSPAWGDVVVIAFWTGGVFVGWVLGQLTVDLYRSRDRR